MSREVATTPRTVVEVRRLLNTPTMQEQIANSLTAGLDLKVCQRQLLTVIQTSPQLLDCTPVSLLSGLIRANELGLMLAGPLGQAYLVPRRNKKIGVTEATFQIGYRGYLNLMYRSEKVIACEFRKVYAADSFDLEYGSYSSLKHRPNVFGERGKEVGAYAVLSLAQGGKDFEFMGEEEAQSFKTRFAASHGAYSPWETNFWEMVLKTCLRRLAKRAPVSTTAQQAAGVEDLEEVGQLPPAVENVEQADQVFGQLADNRRGDALAEKLERPQEKQPVPVGDPSIDEPPPV